MNLCEYGCGQEAKHQFKNGKWCCNKSWQQCPGKKPKLIKNFTKENKKIPEKIECESIINNEELDPIIEPEPAKIINEIIIPPTKVVGKTISKKESFFKRLFKKIRNWFIF